MPWFKVDDTLALHSKVVAAGNAAMGLWVRAGAWSMQQLSDGHIPTSVARMLGNAAQARALVTSGLWIEVEDGYHFHEWGDRQPTRAKLEADRAAKREAGRTGGLRSGRSRREASAKADASALVEPPSHPIPSQVSPDGETPPKPPDRFDEFWDAYDHKVGRKKAETAYAAALKKPGVTPDLLIAAAAQYVAWQKSEGKHPTYTKHPTTWLHGEHWRDERAARQTRVQQHLALAEQLAGEQGATVRRIGDGR